MNALSARRQRRNGLIKRHQAGRRCVSPQGFLSAPPQGRSVALLPLTRRLPADLAALEDRVAKAGVPQVAPVGT